MSEAGEDNTPTLHTRVTGQQFTSSSNALTWVSLNKEINYGPYKGFWEI